MKISTIIESKKVRLILFALIVLALPLAVVLSQQQRLFQQHAATLGQPTVQELADVVAPGSNKIASLTVSNQQLYVSYANNTSANVAERAEEVGPFTNTQLGALATGSEPFYSNSAVATGTDATVHAAWIDNQAIIHYRKKPPGQVWSGDLTLASAQNFANGVSIAATGNTVVVLWRLSNGVLTYVTSNNNGASWSAPGTIAGAISYRGVPRMAAGNGTIYAVWADTTSPGWEVHLGQWNGTAFSNSAISTGANKQFFDPNITVGPTGIIYVTWRNNTTNANSVYLAQAQPGGAWSSASIFPALKLSTGPIAVAADQGGNLHLAWSSTVNGVLSVQYAMRAADGTLTTPIVISSSDTPTASKTNVNIAVSVRPTYAIAHVTWDSTFNALVGIRYARIVTSLDPSAPLPTLAPTQAPRVPAISGSKLGIFNPGPGLDQCGELGTILDGGPRFFKIFAGANTINSMMVGVRDYKQKYPSGIVILRVFDDDQNVAWKSTDNADAKAEEYYTRFTANTWDAMSSADKALIDYIEADNEFAEFDYSQGASLAYDQAASWNWYGKFWQGIAQRISTRTGKKPIIGNIPVGNPTSIAFLDQIAAPMQAVAGMGGVLGYHAYSRGYTTDVPTEENNNSLFYRKVHDYLVGKGVNINLMITEAGIDSIGNATDGWQNRGDATRYEGWLTWFDGQLKADTYVIGATLFQACSPNWSSFDHKPIAPWLKTYWGGVQIPVVPTTPPANTVVCAPNQTDCICRTTPRNDASTGFACLKTTAPWAISLPDPWQSCAPNSTPATCTPSAAGAQPSTGNGQGTILIQFQDEAGIPIGIGSGKIFVSNQSGSDSDNMDMAKGTTQQCFTRQVQPGLFKCMKSADHWYGGVATSAVPTGYDIVDGGTRLEDGDSPIDLPSGGTVTITVVLRANGGITSGSAGASNPDFVPNCLNIQGPTTIRLGQSAKYLAQYDGPLTGKLAGTINAVKTSNPNPKDSSQWDWVTDGNWPPKELGYIDGVLTYEWTPKEAGIYQVFCRAYNENNGNAECRGAVNTVDGPPRYACKGPGGSLTVNVTAAGVDTPDSRADMCEFATTIGGNAMVVGGATRNTQAPLIITAIAKSGFNIKTYSFGFYNLDNQPSDPKPIFFTPNTPYIVDSATNTLNIPVDQLDKPDMNNGGKKPTHIQIKAYFTDIDGVLSLADPKCSMTVNVEPLVPTQQPTATPVPVQAPQQDRSGFIATMGVLIVAIVVSLNFFFS